MSGQEGGLMGLLFPIVLFVLVFYFLILRPQKKKQQQHDKMLSSISRGDTVITAGGFWGKVSDILDDSFIIEISDGVKVRIAKGSISVKHEGSDPKPKQPRPKKKDRPRRESDAVAESAPADAEAREKHVEVTHEEKTALLEDSPAEPVVEKAADEPEQK